jgi:hypothetical protein
MGQFLYHPCFGELVCLKMSLYYNNNNHEGHAIIIPFNMGIPQDDPFDGPLFTSF